MHKSIPPSPELLWAFYHGHTIFIDGDAEVQVEIKVGAQLDR